MTSNVSYHKFKTYVLQAVRKTVIVDCRWKAWYISA